MKKYLILLILPLFTFSQPEYIGNCLTVDGGVWENKSDGYSSTYYFYEDGTYQKILSYKKTYKFHGIWYVTKTGTIILDDRSFPHEDIVFEMERCNIILRDGDGDKYTRKK